MMSTRTGQKASLRPVLFMPCSKSVRDLDRLAKAIVGVHAAKSMQPDFRPTILSRFVSPGSLCHSLSAFSTFDAARGLRPGVAKLRRGSRRDAFLGMYTPYGVELTLV